ncbi:hypothetical protein PP707_05275 [Acetobacter pasteurianus]|nr:hypothetical protein [Acetobacter pasteurianus]
MQVSNTNTEHQVLKKQESRIQNQEPRTNRLTLHHCIKSSNDERRKEEVGMCSGPHNYPLPLPKLTQ